MGASSQNRYAELSRLIGDMSVLAVELEVADTHAPTVLRSLISESSLIFDYLGLQAFPVDKLPYKKRSFNWAKLRFRNHTVPSKAGILALHISPTGPSTAVHFIVITNTGDIWKASAVMEGVRSRKISTTKLFAPLTDVKAILEIQDACMSRDWFKYSKWEDVDNSGITAEELLDAFTVCVEVAQNTLQKKAALKAGNLYD